MKAVRSSVAALMRNISGSQRDISEFLADYYSMIRLYNIALPKLQAWRDRALAQHNMYIHGH